ncbi:hypothetical protein Unana1_02849 [Umbelopsis nana]
MNRTDPEGTTKAWSDIVKTGQTIKIPVTRRSNQATVKYHSEVVYEAPEFQHQKWAAEAESIVKRALNPGSVLFEFHAEAFDKEDAYDLIVKEIGLANGVRPINEYRKSSRGHLLIEDNLLTHSTRSKHALSELHTNRSSMSLLPPQMERLYHSSEST